MSSQGAIAGSDERKSKLTVLKSLRSLFSFDNDGGLKDRLLTAVIVLAVAVGLTTLAVALPLGGLISVTFTAAIAVLSAFEVVRLFARDPDTLAYRPLFGGLTFMVFILPTCAAVLAAVSRIVSGSGSSEWLTLATQVSVVALLVMQVLAGRVRIERASQFSERFIPAFLLVGICAPQLVVLSAQPLGINYVWWLAAVVALNDAGAYFTGRAIGKHKIAPALSPNKTVEGSVAGLLIGAFVAALFGQWILGNSLGTATFVSLGCVVTIAAQAGDLAKSYLKRLRGVKDTGSFFPGHGGILDRFDGMIASAPVVVVALRLSGVL
jgi:phosphatidate cytidylyltransferase